MHVSSMLSTVDYVVRAFVDAGKSVVLKGLSLLHYFSFIVERDVS